jgi:drug/metabolite transporter (DMT)-like permease
MLIMLALIAAGIGKVNLKGKPLGRFILMGLCEPVIYFIAETEGIRRTTSSFSGLMISLIPISTALLSVVFLHERLSAKRFAWILCSVTGVAIISVNQTGEGVISLSGILYLLVAIVSASFFTVLSRSISDVFSPFERTFIMMVMGFIAFTGSAIISEGRDFLPSMVSAMQDKYVILPVLFLSVICSVAAFFCFNYAATVLEVSRIAVLANITPVVSVLAGTIFLNEPFTPVCIIGIILILTGVYMVNKVE